MSPRRRWTRMFVAATAAALALSLAGCGSNGLPDPVTEEGHETARLWDFFIVTAAIVGLLVYVLIGIVLFKHFRNRRRDGLPSQRQTAVRLEVVYTAVPLILVAVLLSLSQIVQRDAGRVSADPDLRVEVIGFQWQWQFRYPDADVVVTGVPGEGPPVLVLPTDRSVQFELRSDDVVHSFWVPHFINKRDLTPGNPVRLEVNIEEAGEWSGYCSEFCGLDHWKMFFTVRAVPPAEFDAWLAEQSAEGAP